MRTTEWQANIHLNDDIVHNCLAQNFKDLEPYSFKKIAEGWDNEVYLVNDHFIFRFPRRKIAVELIERENAVLKAVEHIGVVEIPKVLYVGNPTNEYPYIFHGYKMLPGTAACYAHLTPQAREGSIAILSTFLKQLHKTNTTAISPLKEKNCVYDRTDIPLAVNSLSERVATIYTQGLVKMNISEFQYELATAIATKLPRLHCLVHGDLYSRHLLFNNNLLTGIIDWGDCAINSAAVDLAVIWSFYPPSCHDQFFKIYGFVEKNTWIYARFLGLYSALTTLLYAHDIKDEPLFQESVEAVKRINPNLIQE